MALKQPGIAIVLLSVIVTVLMILNLIEVHRLERAQGEDAGIILDKALSGYLLALSLSFLLVMATRSLCGKAFTPGAIMYCNGIKTVFTAPVIRHLLPVWNLSSGAFA